MGVGAGQKQAGAFGHPAGTPFALCDWWVRYISPIDGVVCDPFMGSGTVGVAAYARDRSFIGIERDPAYFATAQARLARQEARYALFERPTG
jgi:site-specific DNA-methyltransferase (adenine-specific)